MSSRADQLKADFEEFIKQVQQLGPIERFHQASEIVRAVPDWGQRLAQVRADAVIELHKFGMTRPRGEQDAPRGTETEEGGMTYREIGEALGVNHTRVFKIAQEHSAGESDLATRARRRQARAVDYERRAKRLSKAAKEDMEQLKAQNEMDAAERS